MKDVAKTVLGALGWCLLGWVLQSMAIGPLWLGWGIVVLSATAIGCALDKALEPKNKWPV